ncbi:MAG: hypothetical protein IH862_05510, partial [Chloroflexi bacterium]|nr:hypothetical protein [Chloroflexota bacterium]
MVMIETDSVRPWEIHASETAAGAESSRYWPERSSVSDNDNAGWLSLIRTTVYSNPGVVSLYVSFGEERLVDYWILIPHRDTELVRELVRNQHKNIVSLFAQTSHPPFQLDFHIIYREGRDDLSLVPGGAIH